ncbi:hypothetical protein DDN60_15430 [Vibrio cholerae]|nr:hypothetical protein [Vibrio cholerae]
MRIPQMVIDTILEKGYYLAKGAAILNDVVIVGMNQPLPSFRALTLKTPESVAYFNNEISDEWMIFRKLDNLHYVDASTV